MSYPALLFVHGLLRWAVIAGAIWTLARPLDKRAGLSLVVAIDTQMLLGLLLYVSVSPIVRAALSNASAAMKDPVLRFWAVEHPFAMLLAVVAVHGGRVAARRAKDEGTRRRRTIRSTAIALTAVVIGMPWPLLPYGRSLLPHG